MPAFADRTSNKGYECVARLDRASGGAGMTRAARAVHFSSRYPRKSKAGPLVTPNRSVTVPDGRRCAIEGRADWHSCRCDNR